MRSPYQLFRPRLKRIFAISFPLLLPLTAMAAPQDPNVADAVEPLGALYYISVGLVIVGVFVGLYLYYMRDNKGEDKQDTK
jgi:hypothetical protein